MSEACRKPLLLVAIVVDQAAAEGLPRQTAPENQESEEQLYPLRLGMKCECFLSRRVATKLAKMSVTAPCFHRRAVTGC